MKKIRIICLVVSLAIGAGVVLSSQWARHALLSAQKRAGNERVAQLIVSPEAFNIGTAWETDEFLWKVSVENQESSPIQVTAIDTTCNCLDVEPRTFLINPGERQQLRLKINLVTNAKPNITVQLRPRVRFATTNETVQGPEWNLHGKIQKVVLMDRTTYIGTHSELAKTIPSQSIPIEIMVPLETLSVKSSLPGVSASVDLPAGGIGKSMLRIELGTWLPVGRLEGSIILKPILRTGESLPDQRIVLTGAIVNDIASDPVEIQVGGRRIGETFEESVTLRSLTESPFQIIKTEPDGNGLSIEMTEADRRYRVRQKVSGTGNIVTHARFVVSVAGKIRVITIPVRYYAGTTPE